MTPHRYRQLVRAVLFDAAGTQSSSCAHIAVAFNTLCDQLAAVLEPLFGWPAIDALFLRARHLAGRDFPRLSLIMAQDQKRCRVDTLEDPPMSASDLADMLSAVLAYKIDLLITFVGADLVMPLIRRAWPAAAAWHAAHDETS